MQRKGWSRFAGMLWVMAAACSAGCGAEFAFDPDGASGTDDLTIKASGCAGECSPSCPCEEGEGDCDRDRDCAGALVCPPDGKGMERCEQPAGGCAGRCSPQCPCELGQGDCDRHADCAGELVCPADAPGAERCEAPPVADCAGRCSPSCPCELGQGDCDSNADCAGDLVCPPDAPGAEQCQAPVRDRCAGQCSPSCPCGQGEGDCDVDADCQAGLVCPADAPGKENCERPTVDDDGDQGGDGDQDGDDARDAGVDDGAGEDDSGGSGSGDGDGGANRIELPVEVIGTEGTTASRELLLSGEQARRARELWLQINNLGYENKASVRINNGAWLALNHDTAQLAPQEAARGGMVHGGYGTLRLTIPLNGQLRVGANTLSFRFNFSDGIAIGFRVVDLDVLDANGDPLLRDADFYEDDPADWQPPYSDQASIDEGERLWRNKPLVSNWLRSSGNWYSYPIPANTPIRARCADCHTQDGRDLEIFAYSNNAIIERSRFHGMSEEEGKKVASYIRSLSRLDGVGRYGRPWDPPYQPGPAVADRPVHEWAAGAGLQAVLDNDRDMLRGMFGKTRGITRADVARYFDSDRMWNTALQPLSIQLPDWKHWLPLIHPKDAFSRNNWYSSNKQYDPRVGIEATRTYLRNNRGRYTERGLFGELYRFWQHFRHYLAQGSDDREHWRTTDGDAFTRGLASGVGREMAATSLAKLMAVKFFEFHHEFGLQGIAQDIIPAEEQPRARQWLGRQYNVFEIPSHFTGCFKTGSERCHNFDGQPRETGEYESTAWYQLQQVINPGIMSSRDVVPMDYNYQPTLILRASQTSGILEPVRFYFSSNVMYQTRTEVRGASPNDSNGFHMRVMGPWLFYGTDNRNNFERLPQGAIPEALDDIQPGLGTMIVTAQLRQFLKEMAKPRNNLGDWNRRNSSSSGDHRALDPKNLTTADMPNLNREFSGNLRHYAHKIYWTIPRFIELGVDCDVIEDLKDWSRRAWPRVNWDRFVCR